MLEQVIPIIITVDTKGGEAVFLKKFIENNEFRAPIIDVSTRATKNIAIEYPNYAVCKYAGIEINQLAKMRRDHMMETMGKGAALILQDLLSSNKLKGVISIGGNQGTAIASIAMRSLPIGIPKLIISTVASGNVRPYVEYKDITMMFSVADFVGQPNIITRTILTNGAGAVMGMARYGQPIKISNKPVIATTAFGNTDIAVSHARRILESKGYEVVAFHASGAGGSAMEYMIEQGYIQGVLDVTTHELIGEVCGDDIYTPIRSRLVEASKIGIPQVVIPGAIEYFCFGSPDSIPVKYNGRKTHYHNPYNTNIRANRIEIIKTAKVLASKLNSAKGPVVVLIPLYGFSENGKNGNALFEPETDVAFIDTLLENLNPNIIVHKLQNNINDIEFAEFAANIMDNLMLNERNL